MLHPSACRLLVAFAAGGWFSSSAAAAPKGWPEPVRTVEYRASVDGTRQPMLVYTSGGEEKRPLLVGLHTWSGDYRQAGGQTAYARWCIENGWHFIHPHFRGPNWTPDACGSDKVVRDISDAVLFMLARHPVDIDRIYLVGSSGGGHAALQTISWFPEIWAGVSVWVPITDIGVWWEQKDQGSPSKYARHIEKAVGGRPDENDAAALECRKRSPLSHLHRAIGVNLDINAGVTDGHGGGSVPFNHSLHAFNQVALEKDRLGAGFIDAFYANQAVPEGTPEAEADPLYARKPVLFRKVSRNARVTIFQGGHEIIHNAALNWLARQRRGQPAVWTVEPVHQLDTDGAESNSGN